MGRFTYYSPIFLGIAFALLSRDLYEMAIPPEPAWQHHLIVGMVAASVGLLLQVLLIGAQGAFAQVLPAPGGRSIRGSGAVGGGWLLLLACGLGIASGLLSWEGLSTVGTILATASAAALAGFAVVYVWCWPTAQRDFSTATPRLGEEG